MNGVSCRVLPQISDHNAVLAQNAIRVYRSGPIQRCLWDYAKADWAGMSAYFLSTDWSNLLGQLDVDTMAKTLTDYILRAAQRFIPSRVCVSEPTSHPWINERCTYLIKENNAADGTLAWRVVPSAVLWRNGFDLHS